jgi:hypothetical protein
MLQNNICSDSNRRGWELLAISLSFFGPSSQLLAYLSTHIQRNSDPVLDTDGVHISHYAQHCQRKLDRMTHKQEFAAIGTIDMDNKKPGSGINKYSRSI